LAWSDFTGEVPTDIEHEAVTHSQVHSGNGYPESGVVEYMVSCYFIPERSWVREKSADDLDLLEHEQLHFDIAEYSARLFRQKLQKSKVTIAECNANLTALRDSVSALNKEMQANYDLETDHGIDKEAQAEWSASVNSLLEELKDYTEPKFRVNLLD